MLEFNNLSYNYGRREALRTVDAKIGAGLCLVLGENGAGKSTLLGLAASQLLAKVGEVKFNGVEVGKRLPDTLNNIFLLEDDFATPFATVRQMVRYHAQFFPDFDQAVLEDCLETFGLTGNEKIKNLSLGMRHKSGIAYALSLRTALLLLDEPANGLDIQSKKKFRQLMSRHLSEHQTALISTHTVADLEMLYDHLLILKKGRLVLSLGVGSIMERLSFVSGMAPAPDALYYEHDAGRVRSIIPAADGAESSLDFELLYSGLMSDECDKITKYLESYGN